VAVQLRLSHEQADALDAWREAQPDRPSRSEAIRRLVERGLKVS
jgi:Arc/MetJ-type ribon-helix-helix transcriptional regulator